MLLIGLTGSIATGKSTVASILASSPYNLPIIDADRLARQVVEPGTRAYAEIVEYFGRKQGMEDLFLDILPDNTSPTSTTTTTTTTTTARTKTTTTTTKNPQKPPLPPPLNRAALGRRVFGPSPTAQRDRKVLNRIIHPRVRFAMLRLVLYYYIRGHWAVVLDIPLLFESGLDVLCGGVIMVAVRDPEVQMRRLLDRDRVNGLVRIEAENRVLSQGRVAEKVGRTRERGVGRGAVVWNDGTVEDLRGEVERAVGELVGGCWWVAGREAVAGDDDGKEEDGGHRGAGLKLRFPPHRWWNWWLWASPWVAILVAGVEVWRAWRARRRWKAKERERERDGNRTGDGERERQRERERERERDGEKRTANEWRKID